MSNMGNERLTVMITSDLSHSVLLEHLEVTSLSIHIFIQRPCLCSIGGMDLINIARNEMNSTLHSSPAKVLTRCNVLY